MERAKYIIVSSHNLELPIVFNSILPHDIVAGYMKVISAGFCSIGEDGIWNTWGESLTLKSKSRTEDSWILNKYLISD